MIKKFKLEIPNSLTVINLGQYQKYCKLLEDNKGAEESDFVKMKTIEIFCGGSFENVSTIAYNEIVSIYEHILRLLSLHTPLERKFTLTDIKDKSVTFAFIPKLEEMTMGEFIDLDENFKDTQTLHNAMAVLYRPLLFERNNHYMIKPYKDYKETAEAFKDMPLNVALGAVVFFYRLGNELLNYSMDYLIKESEQEKAHLHKALQKNGVGINQFTQLLKEMLQSLTK